MESSTRRTSSEYTAYPLRPFYYARHGRTEHNGKIVAGARTDSRLIDEGREQYMAQGACWPRLPVRPGVIFCSTQVRSIESAEIGNAASGLNLDIYPLPDLREQDYGNLEGLDLPHLRRKAEEENNEREWFYPEGGETIDNFRLRLMRGYSEAFRIFDQGKYEGYPLFVTHGGHPFSWYLLCRDTMDILFKHDIPNASLFLLEPDQSLHHHGFAHRASRVHYEHGGELRLETPAFCVSQRKSLCCPRATST